MNENGGKRSLREMRVHCGQPFWRSSLKEFRGPDLITAWERKE